MIIFSWEKKIPFVFIFLCRWNWFQHLYTIQYKIMVSHSGYTSEDWIYFQFCKNKKKLLRACSVLYVFKTCGWSHKTQKKATTSTVDSINTTYFSCLWLNLNICSFVLTFQIDMVRDKIIHKMNNIQTYRTGKCNMGDDNAMKYKIVASSKALYTHRTNEWWQLCKWGTKYKYRARWLAAMLFRPCLSNRFEFFFG